MPAGLVELHVVLESASAAAFVVAQLAEVAESVKKKNIMLHLLLENHLH